MLLNGRNTRTNGNILNLWSCVHCGYHFETEALLPATKSVNDAATIQAFFPSLLV